jgi:hypothetical protein
MTPQPTPDHNEEDGFTMAVSRIVNPRAQRDAAAIARLSGISDDEMPRKSKAILGVDSLSVSERVLLFCVASNTSPTEAGVSSSAQVMIVKNLLKGDQGGHLAIADFGRRVLESLIR